jgi:uncharacterized membrane protein YvbJ
MPYCPECGKEIKDDAMFCPRCGAPIRQAGITYRMPHRREWTIGRVLAIIFGGIIIYYGAYRPWRK